MSVLVITTPVVRRLVLRPVAQRAAVTTLGVSALVLRPVGQAAVQVVGQISGLNVAPRVSMLALRPPAASKLVFSALRSQLTVGLGQLGVRGPKGDDGTPGSDAASLTPTLPLLADYAPEVDTYADLLEAEPADPENVVLLHAGIGPLFSVPGVPGAGFFRLSGPQNRTVQFGQPPEEGDHVCSLPYRVAS